MEQPIKVYVISDPLAINFLVDDDIDGFKEYLDSDDMLDFPDPEMFETEPKEAIIRNRLYYVPTVLGKGSINLVSGFEKTKSCSTTIRSAFSSDFVAMARRSSRKPRLKPWASSSQVNTISASR
ncbi:MAG: hypothetical protein K2L83_02190 [Muribaculaceae bacterium]|nr:hypothetical protein [Muribaculaceae bacterium]